MLQLMGAWMYRNGNARPSACTVLQEHSMFQVCISYERRACSHGGQDFLGLASVLEHAGRLSLLYDGGLGSCRQQEHE